jgi:hypothetical protein
VRRGYGRSCKFPTGLTDGVIEALKVTLQLDYPDKDGVTLRKKLEQVYESSGGKVRDPLLDIEILIPVEIQHLFELFWKLRGGIGGSGFGPNPISQLEIWCYMQNQGVSLSPGDISIVQSLDQHYIEHSAKHQEKNKG